jgi:UDP-N-acetylmuramoyl-tripeptide--D-alanyl-D-alanine ligase
VAGALAAGIKLDQCARSLNSIQAFDRRMSIHKTPLGMWFINDSFKASYWSVEKVVSQLKDCVAPRKTLVVGSFSDTPGSSSPKYRSIARLGLTVADRVILVGKKSLHIRKMISPELADRLFQVESVEQACRLLVNDIVENELVLIKSNKLEHLERLIYNQFTALKCWKETCGKNTSCERCEENGLMNRM